jgi:RNA recognition motif-containing protein
MNLSNDRNDHDIDNNDDDDDSWIVQEVAVWAAAKSLDQDLSPETATNTELKVVQSQRNKATKQQQVSNNLPTKRKNQISCSALDSGRKSISPTKSDRPVIKQLHNTNAVHSLHVTQLSYDATEYDIRQHCIQAGCIGVQSVRLVYDDHQSEGKKKFRGVAFIDWLDVESYECALQTLHGSMLLSRKINVRPVKSKLELANIVHQTKAYVTQQIRIEKEKKKQLLNPTNTTANHVVVNSNSAADTTRTNINSHSTKKKKKNSSIRMDDNQQPKYMKLDSESKHATKRKSDSILDSNETKNRKTKMKRPNNQKSCTSTEIIPKTEQSLLSPSSPATHVKNDVVTKQHHQSIPTGASISTSTNKLTKQQRNRRAAILLHRKVR